LERKIRDVIKHAIGVSREILISKISRMVTGPEVRRRIK
jgi:hypothetical protein